VAYRVMILYQLPLIGRAIAQLLTTTPDIEVVACLPDAPEGWAQVDALQPDVVIEERELEYPAAALPPLPLGERLRLICLGRGGNEMCLYQAQHLRVTCPDDLAEAIRASGEWPGVQLSTPGNVPLAFAVKKEVSHENLD
jgi:DNA-binding NarL/FixJ family response regulator